MRIVCKNFDTASIGMKRENFSDFVVFSMSRKFSTSTDSRVDAIHPFFYTYRYGGKESDCGFWRVRSRFRTQSFQLIFRLISLKKQNSDPVITGTVNRFKHRKTYRFFAYPVLAGLFPVLFIVCVLSFFPTRQAEANSLFDAIVGAFAGQEESKQEAVDAPTEKNSQNMALASAPLNPNLNKESEENESIVAMEGSAVSASLSVSPMANSDKPKINSSMDQISVYVVHNGDTLSQIADMFDVSANTIRWANDIPKGGALKVGQKLVILPVSGVQYTVKKGDTIAKIAKNYAADADEILDFNGIEDSSLRVGDEIIIPNGVEAPTTIIAPIKKFIANMITSGTSMSVQTDGYFIRPAKGGKTQGIHGHNGIDFSARGGSSVVASASGKVLISRDSGYNGGYGQYIVIQHANGTQTLYAHLSANFVSAGDSISQGKVIGNIGSTGKSTGPHLHFEIRGARNPF